jgi:hypothetical protein
MGHMANHSEQSAVCKFNSAHSIKSQMVHDQVMSSVIRCKSINSATFTEQLEPMLLIPSVLCMYVCMHVYGHS